MTPAEALDGAADYIEEHGWTQGFYTDLRGRVCAEGALARTSEDRYPALTAFSEYLDVHEVMDWNDEPHRTQEQVVKELRACAQSLRCEQ